MWDTERGQVSWVFGLFLLLFLSILLCMQLQIALYRESAMYMEDALALSGLASAVIDVEEYGITQKVRITDPEEAYERYCHALKENLGLDDVLCREPEADLGTGHGTAIYPVQCRGGAGGSMAEGCRRTDTGMGRNTGGGKIPRRAVHRTHRCIQ